MTELKLTFVELIATYTNDALMTIALWDEISAMYSEKHRHYHTLLHLGNMLTQLKEIKHEIKDWDTVLFALFYHDIIYTSTGDKNEVNSAGLAMLRLQEISFPQERLFKCSSIILATKEHLGTDDHDTDYFIDADLSILGQNWNVYFQYAKQVRQEYSNYPDPIYNEGRKRVLEHFLKMNRIFKTSYFFEKFEKQAKENLRKELEVYSSEFS